MDASSRSTHVPGNCGGTDRIDCRSATIPFSFCGEFCSQIVPNERHSERYAKARPIRVSVRTDLLQKRTCPGTIGYRVDRRPVGGTPVGEGVDDYRAARHCESTQLDLSFENRGGREIPRQSRMIRRSLGRMQKVKRYGHKFSWQDSCRLWKLARDWSRGSHGIGRSGCAYRAAGSK